MACATAMLKTAGREPFTENLNCLKRLLIKNITEEEFAKSKQLLGSLATSMNFDDSLKILDTVFESDLNVSPELFELINMFLNHIHDFTCKEKSNILDKFYLHIAALTAKNLETHLFSFYDILAFALRLQCPSLSANSNRISKFINLSLGCLQSKSLLALPTPSPHMQSVLDFILALCKSSCDSFAWINHITSSLDIPPVHLILLVIGIELKLRLPTNLGDYLQVKPSDEKMLFTCFELLSLLIAEIAVSNNGFAEDINDSIIGSLSDDSLTIIMNQLIELGELMATSLAPDQDSPATADAPAVTALSTAIQTSSLLLRSLSVYLQWMLYSYKNQFLGITDDDFNGSAIFDHTIFQVSPPKNKEYRALATRFKVKVWEPLKPLIDAVIPMAFRLTNVEDLSIKWLTLCRRLILRLARLFPSIVISSFDCAFYECLLAECSTEEKDTLKRPLGLTYLADVALLLDITTAISFSAPSSAGDLGDVCVGVFGRLFALISRADWGPSMWKLLFLKGDSVDGVLCKECLHRIWLQLLEGLCDALALLRLLISNLWQEEMAFCLRVAELNALDEIGEKKEFDPEKWLFNALLAFLRRLARLQPPSLFDYKLSDQRDPLLRGFYAPFTLRQSAEALFQCCYSCRRSEFCKRLMRKAGFKKLEAKICSHFCN